MEPNDSIQTSERGEPAWGRIMVLLLVGVAAVQWFVGPWHGSIRPDAGVAEAFFVVKGIIWFQEASLAFTASAPDPAILKMHSVFPGPMLVSKMNADKQL